MYELKCKNRGGYGWSGGFITINGKDYCGDYSGVGLAQEKTVYVEANPSKF